jgi:hypothetical protein
MILTTRGMCHCCVVLCCAVRPLQSAAVTMPRTKVPLSLTINKLMSPQRGIGGVLQLPIKVAGVPLNAARTGVVDSCSQEQCVWGGGGLLHLLHVDMFAHDNYDCRPG